MIPESCSVPSNAAPDENFLISMIKLLKHRLDALEARVSEQESCMFDLRNSNNSLRAELFNNLAKVAESPKTAPGAPTQSADDHSSTKRKIDDMSVLQVGDENGFEASATKQRKKNKKRRRALAAVRLFIEHIKQHEDQAMLSKQLRSIREIVTPSSDHTITHPSTVNKVPEGNSEKTFACDNQDCSVDPLSDLMYSIASTPLNERLAFIKDLMNYSSSPDGTSKLSSLINAEVHGSVLASNEAEGGPVGGKILFVTWLNETTTRINDIISGKHSPMMLFNEDNVESLIYLISLTACLLQLLHKVEWSAHEVKHSRYDRILRNLFKMLRNFLAEFDLGSGDHKPSDVDLIGTGDNSLAALTRDVQILLIYVRSLWDTYRSLYLCDSA